MSEPSDKTKTVTALVSRLPTGAARALYGELAQVGEGTQVSMVTRALAAKINAGRRQHGRRLFTQLFEPFMVADDDFLKPGFAGIGIVHPLDIGGLWSVAAAGPVAALARTMDERIPALADEKPLDLVLAMPELVGLQGRARDEIAAWLASEGGRQAKALAAINRWRLDEARQTGLGFEPRALTTEDLTTFRALLLHGETLRPLVQEASTGGSGGRYGTAARDVAVRLFAHTIQEDGGDVARMAVLMVPLAILHRRRDYRAVVPFLLQGPQPMQASLLEAFDGHLARVCGKIAEETSALAAAGPQVRGPLVAPLRRQLALSAQVDHLDTLLAIYEEFELINDPRLGMRARNHLDQMVKIVERSLYPALIERCLAAGRTTNRALPDQDELIWALGFCIRWRAVIGRGMHWGTGHTGFKERVLEIVKGAFTEALAETGSFSPTERLSQAVRMMALAQPLGAHVASWIGLLDKGLVQTVIARLRVAEPLSGGERELVLAVVELAREELRRTRYWKDARLVELEELAVASGL